MKRRISLSLSLSPWREVGHGVPGDLGLSNSTLRARVSDSFPPFPPSGWVLSLDLIGAPRLSGYRTWTVRFACDLGQFSEIVVFDVSSVRVGA